MDVDPNYDPSDFLKIPAIKQERQDHHDEMQHQQLLQDHDEMQHQQLLQQQHMMEEQQQFQEQQQMEMQQIEQQQHEEMLMQHHQQQQLMHQQYDQQNQQEFLQMPSTNEMNYDNPAQQNEVRCLFVLVFFNHFLLFFTFRYRMESQTTYMCRTVTKEKTLTCP